MVRSNHDNSSNILKPIQLRINWLEQGIQFFLGYCGVCDLQSEKTLNLLGRMSC
jgi:hypothetical protein